jgi:excisionase family DNA binding protein
MEGDTRRTTVTQREAARVLGVSERTMRKWVRLGYVRLVQVGPPESTIWRVPVREVERMKQQQS